MGRTFFWIIILLVVATWNVSFAALPFSISTYPVGHAPSFVAAADVNGDGRLDLICANYTDSTLTILTNSGSGNFGSNATLKTGAGPVAVVAADLKNAGYVNLVTANFTGNTLTFFTNNGSGIFTSNLALAVGRAPNSLAVADLKGSGYLDLVVANYGTNILTVLTNTGKGTFVLDTTLKTSTNPIAVAVADTAGNGLPFIVNASATTGSLVLFTNKGNGRFSSNSTISASSPASILTTDLNGDGRPDLAYPFYTSGTQIFVLTNNGSGNFPSASLIGSSLLKPSFAGWLASTDLNGDGTVDLISCNYTNFGSGVGALVIFTNNNNVNFGLSQTNNLGLDSVHVVAADLNADGRPDLVAVNQDANTLTVLLNNSPYPAPGASPVLALNQRTNFMKIFWASASPGWSLQEKSTMTQPNWLPSDNSVFPVAKDGTNKSVTVPRLDSNRFYRLIHP